MGTITGQILDKQTAQPVANLRIEAWDIDERLTKPIAGVDVGAQGRFKFTLSDAALTRLFRRRRPPRLYFKIIKDDEVVHSTKGTLDWDPRETVATPVEIRISLPVARQDDFVVHGTIRYVAPQRRCTPSW